jgi:hypothetical protein
MQQSLLLVLAERRNWHLVLEEELALETGRWEHPFDWPWPKNLYPWGDHLQPRLPVPQQERLVVVVRFVEAVEEEEEERHELCWLTPRLPPSLRSLFHGLPSDDELMKAAAVDFEVGSVELRQPGPLEVCSTNAAA